MEISIITGFMGYSDDLTHLELQNTLNHQGHKAFVIAWPHFPTNLDKYSISETIKFAKKLLRDKDKNNLAIIGFSMGAIIASYLAIEFTPNKLALIVAPYQAGTEDDLSGKYKEWKETGFRKLTSSKYGELTIPFSFIKDAQKYNSLDIIDQITCPKLFIAAGDDTKVSPEATRKLYDRALEPKEWHLIPGMEHKYKNQPEKLKIVNKIITEFIEEN